MWEAGAVVAASLMDELRSDFGRVESLPLLLGCLPLALVMTISRCGDCGFAGIDEIESGGQTMLMTAWPFVSMRWRPKKK